MGSLFKVRVYGVGFIVQRWGAIIEELIRGRERVRKIAGVAVGTVEMCIVDFLVLFHGFKIVLA
jgi:hypothetical protein